MRVIMHGWHIGKVLYVGLILVTQPLSAQTWSDHRWDKWIFGQGGGLSFSSGVPQPWQWCPLDSDTEGRSAIISSISEGELQLSYHGGLWSSACTELVPEAQLDEYGDQGVLVPQPSIPGHYYAFMSVIDTVTFDSYLSATHVDAEANGGEGEVLGGVLHLGVGLGEGLGVVPGSTEDTVWLWASSMDDNAIMAMPITADGIGPAHIALSGLQVNSWLNTNLKASRNNDRMAFIARWANTVHLAKIQPDGAYAYDLLTLEQPGTQAVDLEFSLDGRFLYAASLDVEGGHIWQYDLSVWQSDAIFASRTAVESDSALQTRVIQLGPDDRIYTWTGDLDSTSLSVIQNPNQLGLACGHDLYSLPLPPGVTLDSVDFSRPNLWWPRDWPTGLQDTWSSPAQKLGVFPTPALQQAVLRIPGGVLPNAALSIIAYAVSGQQVPLGAERTAEGLVLHRGNLPAGVYGILIQADNRSAYRATVIWADGPVE